MAGLASRSTTVVRMRSSPQPSTRAASRYSSGIVRKNWRSRKIENASPNQFGMISGQSLPMKWMPSEVAQLRPHHVDGHDRDLRRQHQRDDHDDEHDLPPSPAQPRERVRDGDAREQEAERREPRVDQRVQRPAPERRLREDVGEVAPAERVRPEVRGQRLLVRHQRREDDEGERREEEDGEDDQHAVVRDADQEAPPPHMRRRLPPNDRGTCRSRFGACGRHRVAPP